MSQPTMKQLAERFLEHTRTHGRPATIESYELALRRVCEVLGAASRPAYFTAADIDRFIRARVKAGKKPNTVNAELRTLKAALRWASDPDRGDLLERMPCKIRMLKVPRRLGEKPLSRSDVERLLEEASPRDRLIVLVAAASGLRIDEVLHLKWNDLDDDRLRVSAKPEVGYVPKSHAEREVYLPSRILEELAAWRQQRGHCKPNDWIFQSCRGGRLTQICGQGRRLFQRAGLYRRGAVWHELRRGAASAWTTSGVDINTVREQLGHADLKTTLRYLRVAEDAKRAAARKGLV